MYINRPCTYCEYKAIEVEEQKHEIKGEMRKGFQARCRKCGAGGPFRYEYQEAIDFFCDRSKIHFRDGKKLIIAENHFKHWQQLGPYEDVKLRDIGPEYVVAYEEHDVDANVIDIALPTNLRQAPPTVSEPEYYCTECYFESGVRQKTATLSKRIYLSEWTKVRCFCPIHGFLGHICGVPESELDLLEQELERQNNAA